MIYMKLFCKFYIMRALIIITLIVLILAIYFRYENFQISEARLKFPFFKVTSDKNQYKNGDIERITALIAILKSKDRFLRGKGKNFIFPGAHRRPIAGTSFFKRKLMKRPQMSRTQIFNF